MLKQKSLILILTTIVLLPEYAIRMNLDVLNWMYVHFSTYYSDLWYCWNNYLSQGFSYPQEYPSGIQMFFILLSKIPNIQSNYTWYMIIISSILLIIALMITSLLVHLQQSLRKIIIFWLCAPSFLFFALYNLDLLPILTMLLCYFCYRHNKLSYGVMWLALGTTLKVFPIFVLPIYLLSVSRMKFWQLSLIFIVTWLCLNVPLMYFDWSAWVFPYVWQIQSNFARDIHDGSWTWLIFQLFDHFGYGNWSGKVSLLLFALGYLVLITKYRDLELETKLAIVMILFLLTDRVYSPQYNLYLLSCLVLLRVRINLFYFYLLEISNVTQCFFLFYIKSNGFILQSILLIKYISLIILLINLVQCLPNRMKTTKIIV